MPTALTGAQLADAFTRALDASTAAVGVSSPNPPVGAVILDDAGEIVGVGRTQPVGGPHAEVMALAAAGERARGGTAVVTLEPCDHTGRTGPCTRALLDAGIAQVYFSVADPNPTAAGGASTLATAGAAVVGPADLDPDLQRRIADGPLRPWLHRQRTGRPLVTAKIAATVDGRIAAPDGSSKWITGTAARECAHRQRAHIDAIIVGTGTVLADDPALTARRPDGVLAAHQPTRIVLGSRDLPTTATVFGDAAPTVQVRSHDPERVFAAVPDALWILVEGGPRIVGAFFDADLVDDVDLYLAPAILGAGQSAVDIASTATMADLRRFRFAGTQTLGEDLLITLCR